MKMKKSLLTQALAASRGELSYHPQYDCYMHWTFLVRDNQFIAKGVNRSHEPPKTLGFHRHVDPSFQPKWHSEVDAIRRGFRRITNGVVAINVRLNRSGLARLALPCSACRNLLRVFGCGKVFFTDSRGWESIDLL